MTNLSPPESNNDPDIFSRGSLKLTYDLIRKNNPQLALNVRNITAGKPITPNSADKKNSHNDHFRVELDSFEVRSIVESLMEQTQQNVMGNDNPGLVLLAKTLIEDWMRLAHKMIAEIDDPNTKTS